MLTEEFKKEKSSIAILPSSRLVKLRIVALDFKYRFSHTD